jgi:Domain of Unknown Function (DUF1080)
MRNASILTLLGLVGFSGPIVCAQEQDKAGPNDNKAPEGFTLLFNGKDRTNWQAQIPLGQLLKLTPEAREKLQKEGDADVLPHWTVNDGILVLDGKKGKYAWNLGTVKDYGDFELMVDWKIGKKADSGIYLRGLPQVQIWDSDNLAANLKEDWGTGSGGLWNNPKGNKGKQPLKKADKPVGEWNTFKIAMKGDNVTVHLNGELVVDDAPINPYWGLKEVPKTGPLELQYHGDKLSFKNIYIRELTGAKN